jgi:hypothetical protein
MVNMILMLIFLRNWLLNKNLHALNSLKMLGLEQPQVNSLILLLFGGWNMARNILMHTTNLDCFKAGDAG